jgi:hypothetical protein
MGFGRSSFNEYQSSNHAARRAAAYSDDEYESMRPTDRRTKPFGA